MNTTLRALINQAERLVRTGVYEEAVALCHAILRRYPRYARCYRILGEAYLGLGEYEDAARLFRMSLGVDPEDPVAYAGLAIVFEERGLVEEAIWQLERAFELAPGRDELRRELGRLYERRGSSAYVQLTRAALARLYARAGLWNKAIGELRDLLVREPYRLDLRVTMASTLWRARQREEAAQVAQAVLDQAPNCLAARLILGTCWSQLGRQEEGRALLEGAQELDPENHEAARLLAKESPLPLRVAHLDTGLPTEAVEGDLEEAEEPEPEPEVVVETTWAPSDYPDDGIESEAEVPGNGDKALYEDLDAGDGHIVNVELEALQELLSGLAAGGAVGPELDELLGDGMPLPAEDETVPEAEPAALAEEHASVVAEEDPAAEDEPEPAEDVELEDKVDLVAEQPVVLSQVAVLQRQLETAPGDPEVRVALALALAQSGRLDEALPIYDGLATPATGYLGRVLTELESIAEANPEHRPLRELLGDAYARAGRFKDAMAMYRWLLAQDDVDNDAGE